MAKYILLVLIVVLVQSANCGRLAKCEEKGKLKKIAGIFLHFLDEVVIFQAIFVEISVSIIMVNVNVAMKHLRENKIPIVAFQRIQHVQRMVEMWIVQMVKGFPGTKSVLFKMSVLWISGVFLQYLPIALLQAIFIVLKEIGFLKFVMWNFQMKMLGKMQKMLQNLLNNIVIGIGQNLGENLANPVMDHFIINASRAGKLMIEKVLDNTWFLIFVSYL